jgi:hypothetical protein
MYVALQTLKIGKGERFRGQPVPEASDGTWSPGAVQALVNQRRIRDMSAEDAERILVLDTAERRVTGVKKAQKKRANSKAKLAIVEGKIATLEDALKPLRAEAESYEMKILEAEEALRELDALDEPERMTRQQKNELRVASVLKAEKDAKAKKAAEAVAEGGPAPEDAGEDPENKARLLRVRLGGYSNAQLLDIAEWSDLDVSELDNLDRRAKKADTVELLARAIEAGVTLVETEPGEDGSDEPGDETATGDDE